MQRVNRLLVAIDFTDVSARELDYAIDLAAKLGAAVTVLHAYQLPFYGLADGMVFPTGDQAEQVLQAANGALDAAVARCEGRGVVITKVLRDGNPAEEIVAVADLVNADIIVVGTHRHGALKHALLGSVAVDVVRTATRPVLTIHTVQGGQAT